MVTIELDDNQLIALLHSLQISNDLKLGNFSIFEDPAIFNFGAVDYSELKCKIEELKSIVFPQLEKNEMISPHSKKLDEETKISLDLFESIKFHLKLQDVKPFHFSKQSGLIKIKGL